MLSAWFLGAQRDPPPPEGPSAGRAVFLHPAGELKSARSPREECPAQGGLVTRKCTRTACLRLRETETSLGATQAGLAEKSGLAEKKWGTGTEGAEKEVAVRTGKD